MSLTNREQRVPSVPRKSYAKLPEVLEVPDLLKVQTDSFRWFQEHGRLALLTMSSANPITPSRSAVQET